MKEMFLFLGVACLGCVIYHLGQKAIVSSMNPMIILMAVYIVSFLMAVITLPLFSSQGLTVGVHSLFCWPVLAIGIGVFMIEGGFLLAYRSGASMQWSGVAVNGFAAVVLLPLSMLLFSEKFSVTRSLGVLVTLAGMLLMTRK